jgi:hypothetical protein
MRRLPLGPPLPPRRVSHAIHLCVGAAVFGFGLALAAAGCSTVPPPPPAAASQGELRYAVLLAGNRAGLATARAGTDGVWTFGYEFNDRGRGPKIESRVALDRRGLPVRLDVSGTDYYKNPAAERFELVEGKASWKNPAEQGEREVGGRAFYLSMQGSPLEQGLLARALLASGGRLELLPEGEARIERVTTALAQGPGFARTVHPNGMIAEQAVAAGFDEIQHVNFLFLNFLSGVDTRTPQRFTAVAEHAADLDLGSPEVRNFLALLKQRQIVIDPTVNVFENLFTTRPGRLSEGWAEVGDRLPPQMRRGLLAGQGLPVLAGMDERYRKSFKACLAMVKALYDNGIPIVAGTDDTAGFALHRELELYVAAGIPAPAALRDATLGPARIMGRDKDLGSIAPGKLADFILVDGDPATRIGDIRKVVLTVKGGVVYDPAEIYRSLGVKPAV